MENDKELDLEGKNKKIEKKYEYEKYENKPPVPLDDWLGNRPFLNLVLWIFLILGSLYFLLEILEHLTILSIF